MKKTLLFVIILALGITACFAGAAIADNGKQDNITLVMQIDNPIMTVNGNSTEIDPGRNTVPIILNDRTLVPIRAIIEAMGGTVGWSEETQTATLTYNDDVMKLTIGSVTAYLNDTENTLDVTTVVVNDRTMLPIRFIAESFNFDVDWNEEESLITITKLQNITEPDSSSAPQNTDEPDLSGNPQNTSEPTSSDNEKILIAYFSQERVITPDMDSFSAATPHIGNTASAAREIQKQIGGDIFEIVTEKTYPADDNSSSGIASQELRDDIRPELSTHVEDMDSYDTIFLGYPMWWGYEPMAVRTFLEEYDFSGKTIIPFCTSGESTVSASARSIQELCPGATVLEGLTLHEGREDFDKSISEWLGKLNLAE